jgi:hypothetical protein
MAAKIFLVPLLNLEPGDCSADQQPTVIMRFPHEVEVTAKRPVKCGT